MAQARPVATGIDLEGNIFFQTQPLLGKLFAPGVASGDDSKEERRIESSSDEYDSEDTDDIFDGSDEDDNKTDGKKATKQQIDAEQQAFVDQMARDLLAPDDPFDDLDYEDDILSEIFQAAYEDKLAKTNRFINIKSVSKAQQVIDKYLDSYSKEPIYLKGLGHTIPRSQLADINPDIKADDANYFITVIHDLSVKPDGKGRLGIENNIGHFYLAFHSSVEKMEEDKIYFGMNPESTAPIHKGEIKDETKRYNNAKTYSEKTSVVQIQKMIPLTKAQFDQAHKYALDAQLNKTSGLYFASMNDCISFTQAVYAKTGLSGRFTEIFTQKELKLFKSLAAISAIDRLGVKGQNFVVQGAYSKEQVSKIYNVDISRVIQMPRIFAIPVGNIDDFNNYFIIKPDNEQK